MIDKRCLIYYICNMVNAINKKKDGMKRTFPDGVWEMIRENPNNPWVEIGTRQEIPVPEVKEVKKEVIMTMNELRKALKEKGVDVPRYSKKNELIQLYNDNREQE